MADSLEGVAPILDTETIDSHTGVSRDSCDNISARDATTKDRVEQISGSENKAGEESIDETTGAHTYVHEQREVNQPDDRVEDIKGQGESAGGDEVNNDGIVSNDEINRDEPHAAPRNLSDVSTEYSSIYTFGQNIPQNIVGYPEVHDDKSDYCDPSFFQLEPKGDTTSEKFNENHHSADIPLNSGSYQDVVNIAEEDRRNVFGEKNEREDIIATRNTKSSSFEEKSVTLTRVSAGTELDFSENVHNTKSPDSCHSENSCVDSLAETNAEESTTASASSENYGVIQIDNLNPERAVHDNGYFSTSLTRSDSRLRERLKSVRFEKGFGSDISSVSESTASSGVKCGDGDEVLIREDLTLNRNSVNGNQVNGIEENRINKEAVCTVDESENVKSDKYDQRESAVGHVKEGEILENDQIDNSHKDNVFNVTVPRSPSSSIRSEAKSPSNSQKSEAGSPAQNHRSEAKSPSHSQRSETKSPSHSLRSEFKSPSDCLGSEAKSPSHSQRSENKSPSHSLRSEAKSPSHSLRSEAKSPSHRQRSENKSPSHSLKSEATSSSNTLRSHAKNPSNDEISAKESPTHSLKSKAKNPSYRNRSEVKSPSHSLRSDAKSSSHDSKTQMNSRSFRAHSERSRLHDSQSQTSVSNSHGVSSETQNNIDGYQNKIESKSHPAKILTKTDSKSSSNSKQSDSSSSLGSSKSGAKPKQKSQHQTATLISQRHLSPSVPSERKSPSPSLTSETKRKSPSPSLTSETKGKSPLPSLTSETKRKSPSPSLTSETKRKSPSPSLTSETKRKSTSPSLTSETKRKSPSPSLTSETKRKSPSPSLTSETKRKIPSLSLTSETKRKSPSPSLTSETKRKSPSPSMTSETKRKSPSPSLTSETKRKSTSPSLTSETKRKSISPSLRSNFIMPETIKSSDKGSSNSEKNSENYLVGSKIHSPAPSDTISASELKDRFDFADNKNNDFLTHDGAEVSDQTNDGQKPVILSSTFYGAKSKAKRNKEISVLDKDSNKKNEREQYRENDDRNGHHGEPLTGGFDKPAAEKYSFYPVTTEVENENEVVSTPRQVNVASPDVASPDVASPYVASPDVASPYVASPETAPICNKENMDTSSVQYRSPSAYEEDFTEEGPVSYQTSPSKTSQKSVTENSGCEPNTRPGSPQSSTSEYDRAISTRPRTEFTNVYESDQNTSGNEAGDFDDFILTSMAPPVTALRQPANMADEKIARPKSSHPRQQKKGRMVRDVIVYRNVKDSSQSSMQKHGGLADESWERSRAFKKASSPESRSVNSSDTEDPYPSDEHFSYSDDLESISIRSESAASGSEVIGEVSHANTSLYKQETDLKSVALRHANLERQTSEDRDVETRQADYGVSDADQDPGSDTEVKDGRARKRVSRESKRQYREASADRMRRIKEAADNVGHMQDNLQDMFKQAKSILTGYQTRLQTQDFTEFTDEVPEFSRTLTSLSDAYKACEVVTGGINEQLQDIKDITNQICDLITTSAKSVELNAWTDETEPGPGDEEKEARKKLSEARLLEIKAISARASADALTAHENATHAQLEASLAEEAAIIARNAAGAAVKRAETARRAEIEKRHAEEEAKRKYQEEQRQLEEERRRRNEEEEMRLGESIIMEDITTQDQKGDKKNPDNWPRFIYSIDRSDVDTGIGVVLKAPDGTLERDDISVTLVDQLSGVLPMGEAEELISNIVRLAPADHDRSIKLPEPLVIAIPHCAPRIHPGREPVVKLLTSEGRLITLPALEVVFEDIKETRFVEMRTKGFGTFAVFLRLKKEVLTFNRKGGKVMSSADSRVTLACQAGAFHNNTSFTLEVQQVDPNLLAALKVKMSTECGKLLTVSPIITMNLLVPFSSPLTITLPVPSNPASRPRRPQTAVNRGPSDQQEVTPVRMSSAKTTFTSREEQASQDEIHLLHKEADGPWTKLEDVNLIQLKKKDVVTFDIPHSFSKLVILRTTVEVTSAQAEKIVRHLVKALTLKPVCVIMRQMSAEPSNVMVTCALPVNVERTTRIMADNGYDHGPRPTPDVMCSEGQRLELRFRGNLTLIDPEARTVCAFNTYIPFKLRFRVSELDKFAQRGFGSYRGFSQIYTRGKIKKVLDPSEERDRATGQRVKDEFIDGDVLLCEHLIILPKPDPETPRPLNVAPIVFSAGGIVNEDLFKFLSTHLEYSDWRKLAQLLNVKHCRIQAILRQNVNNDISQSIYDMLVTWSKRLPRSMDRIDVLSHALTCIRRTDLAEELLARQEEFKSAKALHFKDSYLRKAFVTIAKHPRAVAQWKQLARFLGVADSDISCIEASKDTTSERCLSSLHVWKNRNGDTATVPLLANKLRQCRYRKLAREIECIS